MIYANPLKADTMKKLFLLLALLPSLAFADVDTELNETYQQVLKHRKDHAPLIIQAQRYWLKFINSDCKAESRTLGGSSGIFITADFDICIEDHKKTRLNSLKETYLNF